MTNKNFFFQEFFHFLLPLLRVSVGLLGLYSGVAEVTRVILELFCLVAENYIVLLDKARRERDSKAFN